MYITEAKCLTSHQYSNVREEGVRGNGRGRLTNAWIVGILSGDKKERIESDRRLSLNQETIKSSRNRAARLTSETESDTRRDQKKTLVNKYIVDLTCVYYFLIKRKKLFGQSSTYCLVTCSISTPMCPRVVNAPSLLWDVISFLISCSNRTSFSNDILYRHSL